MKYTIYAEQIWHKKYEIEASSESEALKIVGDFLVEEVPTDEGWSFSDEHIEIA